MKTRTPGSAAYRLSAIDILALHLEADTPVFVEGPSGVAKTAIIKSLLKFMGFHWVLMIPAARNPIELSGMVGIVDDPNSPQGKRMIDLPPEWAQVVASHDRVAIIIDEATTALPSQTAVLLRIVNEREIEADVNIGHARLVVLFNPASSSVGGRDIHPTLLNRGGLLSWPDQSVIDLWLDGLDKPEFPPVEPSFGAVPPGWEQSHLPSMKAGIASYLRSSQSSIIHTERMDGAPEPFSTMRSWTNAIKVLAVASAVGITDTDSRATLLGMHVDHGPAQEAAAILATAELPTAEDVLADPSYVLPGRDDLRDKALGEVAALVVRKNDWPTAKAALDLLERHLSGTSGAVLADPARKIAQVARAMGHKDDIPRGVNLLLTRIRQ